MRRAGWRALQLVVSGGLIAVLLWQLDVAHTAELIRAANAGYLALALAIQIGTTWLLSWRWQILLASKGIHEPIGWLTKLYFISYAASQVLPTSVGGDAIRILEHARRRPDARAEAAGAVVMERIVGGAATLVLVVAGLGVAAGRYDLGGFLWLAVAFLAAMLVTGVLLFSPRVARALERVFPRLRRLEGPLRSFYRALHGYRHHVGALAAATVITLAMQLARIVAMWLCGESVGLDVSPLVYLILGPLLFLVTMMPFTINGLGVREAFFVAFLARFDVSNEAAFATGFLYFALTVLAALPGALILLWRSVRPARVRTQ
jgi:uncharacterized protein (TIRG00374 family)